jgi:uncharacterized protein (TIGR03435 family)
MLQSLLEDRFQLAVHRETRETQAFALTVGKRGMKLAAADQRKCPAPCGRMRISGSAAGVHMEGNQVPVSELVRVLAVSLDRPVLDKTNLAGLFDIRLDFADEVGGTSPQELPGAPVFVALQEQLGLKLEAAKAKISVLVIDRIERPTDNQGASLGRALEFPTQPMRIPAHLWR